MLVQENYNNSSAGNSLILSQYLARKHNAEGAAVRLLSAEAEDKLASTPSLARLNSHETIVSMNHVSEIKPQPVQGKYQERNYLTRKVVKPSELDNIKGGDVIDLLSNKGYAGGPRYV